MTAELPFPLNKQAKITTRDLAVQLNDLRTLITQIVSSQGDLVKLLKSFYDAQEEINKEILSTLQEIQTIVQEQTMEEEDDPEMEEEESDEEENAQNQNSSKIWPTQNQDDL